MIWRRIHGSRHQLLSNKCVRNAGDLGRRIGSKTAWAPPYTRSMGILTYIPSKSSKFASSKPIGTVFSPDHCNSRSITTEISIDKGEIIKAFEGFLSTGKDGTVSMEQLCGIYLERLCGSGNLAEAACLLKHLHNRQLKISLNHYNMLLATAIEVDRFDLFAELFKNLLVSSLPPDLSTYTNVAKAFKKSSESDILKFIREVSKLTFHRDPTVLNRIIFVTATSGEIEKSLMVFEELKNMGCKMDTVTFNTALVILGKQGRVSEMLSEFASMRDFECTPDVVTYNTLVNCFRRLGRLDLCKVYAKEMIDRGFEMELRTYTAIIDAFGRAGLVEDALGIFDEMKKMQPSIYVYRALISDLKKAGKFQLALELVEEMNSSTSKLIGPDDFRREKKRRSRRTR